MLLNFLVTFLLLVIFVFSILLQAKRKKGFDKQPLSYYLTVIIPQNVFFLVIVIFFLVYGNNSVVYLVIGVLIYAGGFFIRLKAFHDLKNNYNVSKERISNKIITSGVYSCVRHPLYLGTVLIYLGFCLMIFTKMGIILYFIFLIPMFLARSIKEEKEFAENVEYQEYKKRSERLIPFVY